MWRVVFHGEDSKENEEEFGVLLKVDHKESEGFERFSTQLVEYYDVDESDEKQATKAWVLKSISEFNLSQLIEERVGCETILQQMKNQKRQMNAFYSKQDYFTDHEKRVNVQRLQKNLYFMGMMAYTIEAFDRQIDESVTKTAFAIFEFVESDAFSFTEYNKLIRMMGLCDDVVLEKISHICFEKKNKLESTNKLSVLNSPGIFSPLPPYHFLHQISIIQIRLNELLLNAKNKKTLKRSPRLFIKQIDREIESLSQNNLMIWWEGKYLKNKNIGSNIEDGSKNRRRHNSFESFRDKRKKSPRSFKKLSQSDDKSTTTSSSSLLESNNVDKCITQGGLDLDMLKILYDMKINFMKRWVESEIDGLDSEFLKALSLKVKKKHKNKEEKTDFIKEIYMFILEKTQE